MLYRPTTALVSFLALLTSTSARGRKGGSGNNGGSDGDDNDANDIGDSDSGDAGGSSNGGVSRPCGWYARQYAFGLPGLYYNGTLTVKHHLKYNPAWEDGDERFNECDEKDREPKTYEYPAMLLIGPTANESDSNPMHWVLRGHEPQRNAYGDVDFLQRWVYIRSSDFIVSNQTMFRVDHRVDPLKDADATLLGDTTRVYWTTNVTSNNNDGKTFSAHAEYIEHPPFIDLDKRPFHLMKHPGKRTSGYITLSDVCRYNRNRIGEDDGYEEDVEKLRISPDPLGMDERVQASRTRNSEKREPQPWASVTPTLWLEKGVSIEMRNIGGSVMSLSLQSTTMTGAIPWVGSREAGCHTWGNEDTGFELSEFFPLQAGRDDEEDDRERIFRPWNVTVEFSLSFEGAMVRENSTTLEGYEGGKLVFGRDYTEFTAEKSDEQEDGAMGLRLEWTSFVGLAGMWVWMAL